MILCLFSLSGRLWADNAGQGHPERTMMAVRVNPTPPRMDGILDDEVWASAPAAGDFVQQEPTENQGKSATENTTIQMVYDDEALYVGITCYDSEPKKIAARLTRRDGWVESDWVSLNLDTHHDHQTGNFFILNAAGVQQDGQMYNDGGEDRTWDGVWEGKAAIHDNGWSAEYKLPYHVLRFSDKAEYIWGMNVTRYISRKKERDLWVLVRRGESGWVSRFGHIEGIKGIHPPAHLEVLPFIVGRSTFESKKETNPEGRELFSTLGADLRYGLSSSISLNATVNPDFGQVEADPAVLNLSVFETFFEERRPFFVEGNTIFQTPYVDIVGVDNLFQLFYSRRIGKQPGLFSPPPDSTVIDQPESTTILGATKLSGKTASKTSFGIMEAVTANEYANIESPVTDPITGQKRTEQSKHRIEPLTNFFVGRVQQDVRTNSNVGLTMTAVNRDGITPAYAGGIDGILKWQKSSYELYSQIAGSRTGGLDDRKNGYGFRAHFGKWQGIIKTQIHVDASSPDFNVNELGFMGRTDQIRAGAWVGGQRQTPWTLARRSGFNTNYWFAWNYDGVNLVKGVNINNWNQLKNYWFFQWGISREFESLDDLETRGGPLVVRPARFWGWFNLGTDERKPISLFAHMNWGRSDERRNSNRQFNLRSTIRLASNVQINIGPSYRTESSFAQWIQNVDDDSDGKDDHYIYGELKSQTLDFTTRASVSFTTNLSLQLYLQPFIAVGDYGKIKELARPESYEFVPYTRLDLISNPDFSRRSLRGNMVIRWEYQPGSTLFVVWSQSRSASFDIDDPEFRPFDNVRDSFTDDGQNIFLVKLNYWLGM